MKKLYLFLFINLLLINIFIVSASAHQEFIKVGLSDYKNSNSIHIDNKEILFGYNNISTFHRNGNISSNYGFDIKIINTFTIKTSMSFNNYIHAINYIKNKENMYVYKENNDTWIIYNGNFTTETEALNYLKKNNINGKVHKLFNTIGIYSNNYLKIAFQDKVSIKAHNEHISILNKKYRNMLEIRVLNNYLNVINILDVEEYLYGVVPSEMPSSWEKEALKAQAVAARNYAYVNKNIHFNENYDICDTLHCQIYKGVSGEERSTNQAVDETKNILAYYNNEKINAFYYSSNGGYSDDSENVWFGETPYLRAVKDENEEGGKVWTRTFTFNELTNLASNIGNVNKVILETSLITGRVISLELIGEYGEKVLKKEEIRSFFSKSVGGSLESRNFKMLNNSSYINELVSPNKENLFFVSSSGKYSLNLDKYSIIKHDRTINNNNYSYIIDKNDKLSDIITKSKSNNKTLISTISRDSYDTITFSGKGWGHGVGMSQYGANSLAKKGYTYDEILKYYYTGIEVR